MKTKDLRDKYVIISHLTEKVLNKIKTKAKEHIKSIQCATRSKMALYKRVNHYNSYVMGIHNYYKMATAVNADFQTLAFEIKSIIKIRLQERVKKKCKNPKMNLSIKEKYGKSKEIRYIGGNVLVPIGYISHSPPIHKKKIVNKYTLEGRKEIHKMLESVDISMVHSLMRNPTKSETIEYNDNRISLYVAQKGKCSISSNTLSIERIHCHHKKPRKLGGNDSYSNLIIVDIDIHRLIHATDKNLICDTLRKFKLDKKQLINSINLEKILE